MNSSCFVVPVHPPKFADLADLLISYDRHFHDKDVIVVFTNQIEYEQFISLYPYLDPIHVLHGDGLGKDRVITEKKFKGLQSAFDLGYEYAAVIDAECIFLKNFDYDLGFQNWFSRRTLYSNLTIADSSRFVKGPLRFFSISEQDIIIRNTNNTAYCWFNEVPIYERRSFESFISGFDFASLTWYDFDHILYQYDLIANHQFSVQPIMLDEHMIRAVFGFVECQRDCRRLGMKDEDYARVISLIQPMWIVDPFTDMPQSVFIQFHKDRK